MPQVDVVLYQESGEERPPIVAWLDGLPGEARIRCLERLERLAES